MMSQWTRGLNPEQCEAVLHTRGPLLILAGAGSGKTTVLVSRTGHLLEHEPVKASEICVLTFTTKAASELKHRVTQKVGDHAKDLWTGTFHSFGLKLLRRYHKLAGLPSGFGVIDQSDSQEILKELVAHLKNSGKESFKIDRLLTLVNKLRETGKLPSEKNGDEYEEMALALWPKYVKRLEILGVVDFEGLLLKPLELFKKEPQVLEQMQNLFKHMMVDEFQDTNETQFNLVQALVQKHKNIAVVGDDDQSIYGWRGACVSNILDFPKNYDSCKVIRLERNYRSTPAIIHVANEVISKNTARHGKTLRPDPKAEYGQKPEIFIYDNDDTESEQIVTHVQYFKSQGYSHQDIAILYRSNGQGGLIEAHLRQNNIPYKMTGGTGFFERKETKDLLAYLRSSLNPNEIAFRRILNSPSRGIGDATVEKIEKYGDTVGLKFHVAARKWKEAEVQEKIGEGLESLFRFLDNLPGDILKPNPEYSVGQLLLMKLREIGYREYLGQTCKNAQVLDKKWNILEIFCRVLDSFIAKGFRDEKTLLEFVDAMELRDLSESLEEKDQTPKVQLFTLHAC
ncbi:MAG: ATP-dependent helicase, partial [Pseudobdellovibrionaceae bacterium]